MLYTDFTAGNKNYKLRLNTRNVVELEKKLGCNPLAIFGTGEELEIPTVTTMVTVLFYSLQALNHGITFDDSYDIFDDYLADGNTVTDFIYVILDVYKTSGMIKDVGETEKN